MALASKSKTYVELGVREGHTSEPIYEAAKLNEGHFKRQFKALLIECMQK